MAEDIDRPTRRTILGVAIALPTFAAIGASVADAKPTTAPVASEPAVDVKRMPRIKPLVYEEADEKTRKAWQELLPPRGGPTQTPGVEHDLFRIGMHHPELHRVHSPLTQYLKNSTILPIRHRELAILRSAWLGGVDDQFVNHTKIGIKSGLTPDEVDRIPKGPDAPGWSSEDAAVLRAADELYHWSRIGDDTWAALARQYDKRQLLEFLALVGNYRALSYVQNSVGIRPVTVTSPNISGNRFLFSS